MNKKITFLGIETSCDETAAAVIRENEKGTADILSNVVSSQIEEHKKFGGVVPELAARAHLENIEFIIDKALKDSKISLKEISSGPTHSIISESIFFSIIDRIISVRSVTCNGENFVLPL